MKRLVICSLLLSALAGSGCANHTRAKFPTTQALRLDRVVLYRNGVGYFERRGEIDGDVLRLKVRKDQINDLLKSLTIVDRKTGKALSVSMPLDPQTWANAALSTLAPGRGSLSHVLDKLRGVDVALDTTGGTVEGRIVMVERIVDEPDPTMPKSGRPGAAQELGVDHKLTLMHQQELRVVRLSKVKSVTIKDGDLAMQFHRRLDATAGEGMFQQVEIAIRLQGDGDHDLVVSYVVEAPMWKPTYRVVLPENGKGDALLQAWAVVDNVSGEDWTNVKMSLTAGAPIAFQYDLHTPRKVYREDLSESVHRKRARVAMGETSYDEPEPDAAADESKKAEAGDDDDGEGGGDYRRPAGSAAPAAKSARRLRNKVTAREKLKDKRRYAGTRGDATGTGRGYGRPVDELEERPVFDLESLRKSTQARAKATQASGLTKFDLGSRVTVPDGSATMVAIVNQVVKGEETFLFKPGGAGSGYEQNPYRVIRFKNSTPFVLEPGPISIYSGGSFVGEGISETVGAGTSATVPFAVETGIMMTREGTSLPEHLKLVKIVRGVIHVQRFSQYKTVWKAKAQTLKDGFTVLVRHPRFGYNYQLKARPSGTEDLPDAYLVPLVVQKGSRDGSIEIVEQTPVRTQLSIWDGRAVKLLSDLLLSTDLSAVDRAKLEPLVKLRQEIGKIDTQITGLERQKYQFNQRADETRENLYAIEKDKSAEAAKLRRDLQKRMDDFSKQGDAIGLEIAKLNRERLQLKIKLEDGLAKLDIAGPADGK